MTFIPHTTLFFTSSTHLKTYSSQPAATHANSFVHPAAECADCRPGSHADCSGRSCRCLSCPQGFYCPGGLNVNASATVAAAGASAPSSGVGPAAAIPCGVGLTTRAGQLATVRNDCGRQSCICAAIQTWIMIGGSNRIVHCSAAGQHVLLTRERHQQQMPVVELASGQWQPHLV